MPKIIQMLKTLNEFKEIVVFVFSVLVISLGAYIAFNLVPVYKILDDHDFRINAAENFEDDLTSEFKTLQGDVIKIKEDVSYIRGVLESNK